MFVLVLKVKSRNLKFLGGIRSYEIMIKMHFTAIFMLLNTSSYVHIIPCTSYNGVHISTNNKKHSSLLTIPKASSLGSKTVVTSIPTSTWEKGRKEARRLLSKPALWTVGTRIVLLEIEND